MADIKYLVEVDATGAVKSVKNFDGALDDLKKKSGEAGTAHRALWKDIALGQFAYAGLKKAGREVVDFIGDSIKASMDAENAEKSLRSALASTGQEVSANAAHYIEYSSVLQGLTTHEDDEIQTSQALLIQMGLTGEKVDEATRGALGLSSVMGMDLQSATRAVAMAYQGNFMQLGRMMPAVRDAKTDSEKLAAAQAGLSQMFQRAQAETGTFSGSLKQLKNSWDDVQEGVGGAITKNETIIKLIQDLKAKAEDLVKSGKIEEWATNAAKGVRVLVDGLELLGDVASGLSKGPTGAIQKFLDHFMGVEDKIAGARRECVEFRSTLQVLKPSLEELRKESEKGPESFREYQVRMKSLDDQLVANKDTIAGWIEKGAEFLGLNQKLPEPIKGVGDAADKTGKKVKTLAEELGITLRSEIEDRAKKLNEALLKYQGKLTADEVKRISDEINSLGEKLRGLKGPVMDIDAAIQQMLGGLDDTAETVASGIAGIFQDEGWDKIKRDGEQVIEKDVPEYLKGLPVIAKEAAQEMGGIFQEVSTVISDSMREIAGSIVGAFDFKSMFGADIKTPKFDTSFYDDMIAAASSAYEKEKGLIESSVDALKAATDKEVDLIKSKYDAMEERARDAFSAEELARSRAEQDEDIRRSRHEDAQDRIYEARYDRERKAIQDSSMTEGQKDAALLALEKKYDAEKLAREIAREDAALARDRKREDAKLKRQEAQERKLEAIRAAGAAKEQALRDASAVKEQAFLTNLLNLQNQHQLDLDAIRTKEDLARQEQADKEEKRQGSLWFKVKGIFATAVGEMATIWLTNLIGKILPSLGDIGKTVKDTFGKALDGLSKTAGDIAGGLLSSLGSIGSIVSGITSVIELFKGPQKQTDVTYWLKLQWELQQNMYNIFGSGMFTNFLVFTPQALGSLCLKTDVANSFLNNISGNTKSINAGISDLVKKIQPAASGYEGTVRHPTLFLAHPDEDVSIRPRGASGGGGAQAISGGARGGGGVINLTIPFYLDGQKLDERTLRIANDRVEWLHSQYKSSNRHIPARTIGGP